MSRGTFQWGKTTWKKVVFNFSLSVFDKKVLWLLVKTFWQTPKQAFYVSRGTVCGKLWVKKRYESKFSWGFFDKLRTFVGKFPAFLSKLHSTCRATFWEKLKFSSLFLIDIFLDIEGKLSRVWRNFLRKFQITAFYMSEGETLVLFNFWGENFVSESFCSFQWINGFRAKPYLFFLYLRFRRFLKAAF